MNSKTKKMVTLAVLAAISYILMFMFRIPVVMFLKYEPKDVVIAIAGFIYGPISAMAIAFIVGFFEMVTVSTTGLIGMLMNVMSSCAFACTAAYIYKKKQTMAGAVIGLLSGVALATIFMLLWNYLITPMYLGYPREAVAEMLIPVFLPFNLLKWGINAGLTMLLYKPVVSALRRSKLIPESVSSTTGKMNVGVIAMSLLVVATCVMFFLVFAGVL